MAKKKKNIEPKSDSPRCRRDKLQNKDTHKRIHTCRPITVVSIASPANGLPMG